MTWRFMNFAYFLLMLLLSISLLPGMIGGRHLVMAISMTWLLRCSIVPLTNSVRLVVFSNLVCHLCMHVATEWTRDRNTPEMGPRGPRADFYVRFVDNSLAIDTALSLLSCLISTWLEHTTCSIVEKSLETAMLKNEAKACESLLATFCDAHLFLDSALRLVKDMPNLASMLFRASNNAGTDFMQCLATQEAMHLALRDGYGNTIPVECFHVKTVDAHDQIRHLVGLREDRDPHLDLAIDVDFHSLSKSVSETTSQSSACPDSPEEAFLIFDASELDIMGVSPNFLDATGLDISDDAKFSDFLDFQKRLKKCMAKGGVGAEEADEDLEKAVSVHFWMELHMKLRNGGVTKSKWKFYVQHQHEQIIVQGVLIQTVGRLRLEREAEQGPSRRGLITEYSRPGSSYVVSREFPPRPGSSMGSGRLGIAARKPTRPIDILEEEGEAPDVSSMGRSLAM
ncbi:hypothetical protein AK812_SmicGene11315 [Symbiodinium microadriaticum]|uniref:Uncharacterized protein n=1 Tax=Symbiodinium microadriaticum TaxID=2951 RepID=A0A1Q9EDK5_SYMMI|nr:hypothetical protein AK812_SmicGene11315 [Symbiodinium microadriaticum]